jgi:hypothetical protein
MPFNVNPVCPTGQKTVINWQFPGQAAKTNDQGDDYNISFIVPSNVPRVYLDFTVDVTWGATPVAEQYLGGVYAPPTMTTSMIFSPRKNASGLTIAYDAPYTRYKNSTGTLAIADTATFSSSVTGLYYTSTSNLRIVPRPPANNNQSIDYQIAIYKNGQIIATDTGKQMPVVSHQCIALDQCPPNTCDVLCENTICCYNSDGISVFNYPNT